MYITYCRNQKSVDVEDKTSYRLSVTGGDYRPTWLIRVSDWQKVPGKAAINGYHTISYCWEQSGEVVKNEADDNNDGYSIVDNGKHCIVEEYNLYEDLIMSSAEFSDTSEDDDQDSYENLNGEENSDDYEDLNEISEEDDDQDGYENVNRGENSDDCEDRNEVSEDDDDQDDYENVNTEENSHSCDDHNEVSEDDSDHDNIQEASNTDTQESNNHNEYVTWCEPKSKATNIRYVTYDQLLQQVCKDFQVEYVWYDKICIDQSDNESKPNEIKQMHKIYRNARYTIAMIPELLIYDPEDFNEGSFQNGNKAQDRFGDDVYWSCWWKRSWTLEEVMMAKRILIVGTDTNMFQHSLNTTDIPTTLDDFSITLLDFGGTEENKGSANQALAFAHFRTSTKPHDIIYSLKNTFSYMFDDIEVDYTTDIKTVFNDFYRHIATDDFSILCFANNLYLDGSEYEFRSHTTDNYNLPSWTGVAGKHISYRAVTTTHPELEFHIDDTMWMHITTTRYWNISVTPFDGGCYSLSKNSTHDADWYWEQKGHIVEARYSGEWTDLTTAGKDTVLLEWLSNMHCAISAWMTHYHQLEGGLLTQLRPLTLTEDCEECIVLPILLEVYTPATKLADDNPSNFIIEYHDISYFLPVFCECTKDTGRYKAVGLYYLGEENDCIAQPLFQWSHFIGRDDIYTYDTKEIINILFENNDHDVPKEFIIE